MGAVDGAVEGATDAATDGAVLTTATGELADADGGRRASPRTAAAGEQRRGQDDGADGRRARGSGFMHRRMLPSVRETATDTGDRPMPKQDAQMRDVAGALTPSMRDRFHIPIAPDGSPAIYLAGQSLGLQPRTAARGDRHGARRVGAPRRRRLVRPGPPLVHARWIVARVDGADRRGASGRGRAAQQPDRRHPPPARLVLPAGGSPSPDPRRRSALPVRPSRPDDPPRLARPGSRDGPRRRRAA